MPTPLRLLGLLACCLWTQAQDQDAQPSTRFYVGTIGAWDLRLTVELSAAQVQGRLRSSGLAGPLRLQGPAVQDDRIDCQATDSAERPFGRFQGRFTPERGFLGRFTPSDRGPPLPIAADEAAEFLRSDLLQGPFYRLTSTWPVFTQGPPLLARLNAVLPGEMRRLDEEFLGPPADRRAAVAAMRQDCSVEVVHCSATLVSLLVTRYSYTGGAHGNTEFLPLTWTWLDGAPFPCRLADLFTDGPGALAEIKARCAEDLARQGASEASHVAAQPPAAFRAFCVSRNGLAIHFPPYAVGCYAEGAFQVTIPWTGLLRFLDRQGPLAELLPRAPPPAGAAKAGRP